MPRRLETKLDGVVLIEPDVHGDARGFLVETFRRDAWAELGVDAEFVQHNHSRSVAGHPARPPLPDRARPGEAGALSARPDLRCRRRPARDSPTYGQWEGYVLDDERHRQLFVPVGFAHGFAVLSDVADVTYLVSSTYDPATESGIAWDDPEVGVEWPVEEPLLSTATRGAPTLAEVAETLPFKPAQRRLSHSPNSGSSRYGLPVASRCTWR